MSALTIKRKFTARTVSFILSFVVDIVFCLFLIITNTISTRSTLHQTEQQYQAQYDMITESYDHALSYALNNYIKTVRGYTTKPVIATEDKDGIQEFLIDIKPNTGRTFHDFYFVCKDGTALFQDGSRMSVVNQEYYKDIVNNGKDLFVNYQFNSRYDSEPVIIIAVPAVDKSGTLHGMMTCTVTLSVLHEVIVQFKTSPDYHIFLLEKNGRFLVHKNPEMLLKSFIPLEPEYQKYSSIYMAQQKSGSYTSMSSDGNLCHIYFRPVPNTDWVLGLSVNQATHYQALKKIKTNQILYTVIAFCILILLLCLETNLLKVFEHSNKIVTEYDSLTHVYTQEKFRHEAAKKIRAHPKSMYMLVDADIRGLKFINEKYKDAETDELLKYFASHLQKFTEKNGGIIGRGYSDHFYQLFKVDSKEDAMNEFLDALDLFNHNNRAYPIPFFPKFGIAFLDPKESGITQNIIQTNSPIQNLIGKAAFAKSTIKDDVSLYAVFDNSQMEKVKQEQAIINGMKPALENNEFFVMYQPKISLKTGKIAGAEALVRWNSKEFGLLTPDKFIPVFEKNNSITQLDFYVYEKVFQFIKEQLEKGNKVVPISVNMSRNHVDAEAFLKKFLELQKQYGVDSKYIQVEILERSSMGNTNLAKITQDLKDNGFTVAMDDFGSGESSLNMLTSIPVDVIKFDRDFLHASTGNNGSLDERNSRFINSLIQLSKTLDKETVFEGVETENQIKFLKTTSCDQVQGYYYSKPLTQEDYEIFTKQNI